MGAVGGLLGLSGGAGGTGFNNPQGASQQQAETTYNQAQQALGQQGSFVNGLVMNANPALSFQNAALQGYANLANGVGPNPAQAQLNQATGQNIANQAALMAGQRGANANIGLIGRQAAMQGANTQQQAIGQAASLQAQQQLQGLSGMAGQANQLVGQAQQGLSNQVSGTQGIQSNVLNSLAGQNSANASMANTRMGQQGNLIGNVMGGIGSAFNLAEGGEVPKKYADGGNVVPGSGVYADPMSDPNNPFNRQPNPMSPAASAPMAAPAPIVPASAQPASATKGPRSIMGKFMAGMNQPQQQMDGASQAGQFIGKTIGTGLKNIFGSSNSEINDTEYSHPDIGVADPNNIMKGEPGFNKETEAPAAQQTDGTMMAAKGGKVPVLLSPGEKKLTPEQAKRIAKGGKIEGETVPGKPKVKGAVDSYANDIIPDKAEPGTIILPRSVTQAKNPAQEAHKFVSAIMAKQGKLPKKSK